MKTNKEQKEIIKEFLTWGSGFTLEADRDYDKKGAPFIYSLKMHGLYFNFPKNISEFIGYNIIKLMKQAIKEGNKNFKKVNKTYEKR